jgi:PAS domain S-box-containing protein
MEQEQFKALLAEDSVILNNLLRDVFEERGFRVTQAYDGQETIEAFSRDNPDVAVVDIQMPRIDGVEALRVMKEKDPDLVVIMMTGAGTEETALQCMRLGADEYLRKPFNPSEVVAMALKMLEGRATERENRRLRETVRNMERYLAHVTTIINEALITADLNGKIQFVNKSAIGLWGYPEEEIKGRSFGFLVSGSTDTIAHKDLILETLQNGGSEGEFHFRKRDGSAFPGYLSTSLISEHGRATGIAMVVTDLTRLREIERRLQKSEKLASLGRVVEGVAHEVRNCLTSLGGFARRLGMLVKGMDQGPEFADILLQDVGRLEKMVHEIEDYVKYAKFYNFNFRRVDLASVIERSHSEALLWAPEVAKDTVEFELIIDGDAPEIEADPSALQEAFAQIIVNAYEAMPKGGKLIARVSPYGPGALVSLSDTGAGISDEEIREIFSPFVTSKTSGAGMGLSKVHLLVEEHGGSINVESSPGAGSTFQVLLPADRRASRPFLFHSMSKEGTA